MKKEKVSEIIGLIDEKYVGEATAFDGGASAAAAARAEKTAGRRPLRVRWAAAAACLILAAGIGTTVYAFAAEVKEYNTAMAFFEENGLSAEGLSRAEVKEVYRDITTRSFTCEKTAEVLRQTVPGLEIEQNVPTPEELAALWESAGSSYRPSYRPSKNGVSYRFKTEYAMNEEKGFETFERSVLTCSRDDETLWTAEFTDFCATYCAYMTNGTAVWGWTATYSSAEPSYAWLARVDDDGTVLWQTRVDHSAISGFSNEYIGAVVDNGDGTWAVFSRSGQKTLYLSQYDADGHELSSRGTEVGIVGIWNAARLGDGYIVQLGNSSTGETAHLYRMDRAGNLIDSISYESEECVYVITDMIEFGGRVYLSSYAYPHQKDEGGRDEIANILDFAFPMAIDEHREPTDEELTAVVRDNYTAVLLVCDAESGTPETFWSVKGSLGGKLAVNEAGELEWDTESVVSTFLSMATSSFTIGGTCEVFRYTFDEAGTLIRQIDTGETAQYRR